MAAPRVRAAGGLAAVAYVWRKGREAGGGNVRRDVVMMSEADAKRLGLTEGDRVVVSTEAGRLEVSVAIVALRPGNLAMYYPEANVLVPRRLDERSKTPAFKSVRARLETAAANL